MVILCPGRAKKLTNIIRVRKSYSIRTIMYYKSSIKLLYALYMLHCVGGCPVPTHSVFITTAVYITHAIALYKRAELNLRLFALKNSFNNQIAGLKAIIILSGSG